MATNFERWEKDPFFPAAEEVQASADRMESTYRTWVHAVKDTSGTWNTAHLWGDLRTSLGTTKWQLEEFERAVRSSYQNSDAGEAKNRHHLFVLAIEDKITLVEKSLRETPQSSGKTLTQTPWVRLDEGERDELALFLSGVNIPGEKLEAGYNDEDKKLAKPRVMNELSASTDVSTGNGLPSDQHAMGVEDGKLFGIRRTASASADIGSWKVTIDEGEEASPSSSAQVELPPKRVPSSSAIISSTESAPKLNLFKYGFRKWKRSDHQQDDNIAFLRSPAQSRGGYANYDRSRSSLDDCDDCYDKHLYSWYGALQRLVQRSQYHMLYGRHSQATVWVALLVFSIGEFIFYYLWSFSKII